MELTGSEHADFVAGESIARCGLTPDSLSKIVIFALQRARDKLVQMVRSHCLSVVHRVTSVFFGRLQHAGGALSKDKGDDDLAVLRQRATAHRALLSLQALQPLLTDQAGVAALLQTRGELDVF